MIDLERYDTELLVPAAIRFFLDKKEWSEDEFKNFKDNFEEIIPCLSDRTLAAIKEDMNWFNNQRVDEIRLKEIISDGISAPQNGETCKPSKGVIDCFYKASIGYALGRRTYITSEAIDWTKACLPYIDNSTKRFIINKIQEALEENKAGDDVDKFHWTKVKELLEK